MSRILLLVPRLNIGGAETYVYTVAKELHERGQEVFVASGGGKLAEALSNEGIKTFFVPVRFNKKLACYMLLYFLKKYKIDILHANSGAAGEIAAWIKSKLNIKVVYTAHGIFGDCERERVIDQCDKIICVSNYVQNYALERGFTREKLITHYTGIDSKKFVPNLEARQILRQQYGIADDTFVLGIVSRIKNFEQKGHGDLLEIFSRFPEAKNWKLVVVGKGNGLIPFKLKAKTLGIEENIICLGHRTDVEYIGNVIDVLVLPTIFETFGLVIAEAMALGKPAVVYSIGGTPEVVRDGETGYLIEHKNIEAMYQAIKKLADNKKLLEIMGQNACQWVRSSLDLDQSIDNIELVYEELLAKADKL